MVTESWEENYMDHNQQRTPSNIHMCRQPVTQMPVHEQRGVIFHHTEYEKALKESRQATFALGSGDFQRVCSAIYFALKFTVQVCPALVLSNPSSLSINHIQPFEETSLPALHS